MRLFVCEFVTGGGFAGQDLSPSLLAEGAAMLRALLDDLAIIPDLEIVSTYDSRIEPLQGPASNHCVARQAEAWPLWRNLCAGVDAVWPIAPESAGSLERLSRLALDGGGALLGTRPDAVRVAASKLATFHCLRSAGVPTVETRRAGDRPPSRHGWVVKPDDGAGCADTWFLADDASLAPRLDAFSSAHVWQPYVPGPALSLSLLFGVDRVELLSVNRQSVALVGDRLRYEGVETGVSWPERAAFVDLAVAVQKAMPGLWGYVGLDLIVSEDGPVLVDVNPRLTGSYIGLRDYLGTNPAARVLELLRSESRTPARPLSGDKPDDERIHV